MRCESSSTSVAPPTDDPVRCASPVHLSIGGDLDPRIPHLSPVASTSSLTVGESSLAASTSSSVMMNVPRCDSQLRHMHVPAGIGSHDPSLQYLFRLLVPSVKSICIFQCNSNLSLLRATADRHGVYPVDAVTLVTLSCRPDCWLCATDLSTIDECDWL